jgi:hypothetical protein
MRKTILTVLKVLTAQEKWNLLFKYVGLFVGFAHTRFLEYS